MPRFLHLLWLFIAVYQGAQIPLVTYGDQSYAIGRLVLHGIAAACGLMVTVWSTSWTSARSEGLRLRNGWSSREILWQDVASVQRNRLWGFVLRTRDGGRHPMQGLTQGRLGHLLHIWAHYRGEEEPALALARRDRHGLWTAEVRQFLVHRLTLGVVIICIPIATALVILFTGAGLTWVLVISGMAMITLVAALCRVLLAGTVVSAVGVKVRTPVRTQHVSWPAVQEVSDNGHEVVLRTDDGDAVPLVGISADERRTIERTWAAATGSTSA